MGNKGNITNRVHGSLLRGMQPLQKFVDNGNKPGKFIGGSLEIFGREHIQRDLRYAQIGAPAQKVNDALGSCRVPLTGAQPPLCGPTPVAVHQHTDVCRKHLRG